ncbi:2'-5' RNA ligase family protein [Jiella mangrovi]|uniref:2'-5' RNA ligase family protein n=1 Tax=Jiella mangrovi TaxID=2821407 RepID=A0ABS4BLD9_9HYPH|nr:2'-5' RNA ligase family protein [Jiella mangrovi]MBP0617332.1 2'-5' RNA ligase family protein [Jiella mangrovi]
MADTPLILTVQFDDQSFAVFDGLRRRHFPPSRNLIPAHLTLFHHLPGGKEAEIAAALRELTRQTPPLPLNVSGLRFLGFGSAFEINSAPLTALRKVLAQRFQGDLTPQDAQGFRPHVTIQNKVPAHEARATFETLRADFTPFAATGTGLLLWHYLDGPWEEAGGFPFTGR